MLVLVSAITSPAIFAGPSETSKVTIAGAECRKLGIHRFLVVRMLTFFFKAVIAQCLGVEPAHAEVVRKGRTAPITEFFVEPRIHFSFLSVEFLDYSGKYHLGFGADGVHIPTPVIVDKLAAVHVVYPQFADSALPDAVVARLFEPHQHDAELFAVCGRSGECPLVADLCRG